MAGLRLDKLRSQLIAPIQLELNPGELVFLSGPSGAGKSLLLRAIADLDPNEGEVWLDKRPRSVICAPDWRRQVGLLPAESGWWSTRVGEHFPSRPRTLSQESGTESGEADTEWLRWLQALGFGPEVLDWEVARLSTGERQRLALARLLAAGPAVLLLDEATANLDHDNAARVESLVQDYRRSRQAAVLWVSHDPAQRQRLGNRTFRLQGGKLIPEPIPRDQ